MGDPALIWVLPLVIVGIIYYFAWIIENVNRHIERNVSRTQVGTIYRSSRQPAVYANLSDLLPVPSHWSRKYDEYEVYEDEISPNTSEGRDIWLNYLSAFSCDNITRITRVQNPFLYHRYQLRKQEYLARGIPTREFKLLHATSELKASSILKNNFDWRYVRRSKLGKGVSFSPKPGYAHNQSSRNNGSYRAMIVVKVLVGRSHIGDYNCQLPKDGYDTTTGNGTKVYVKYYDDEFYPEFVVYYNL